MDDSDPKPAIRDESGRFPKGVSGNPKGRSKLSDEVRDILKAATKPAAEKLVKGLEATKHVTVGFGKEAFLEEVPDFDMQVKCANHILDRVAGKPAQAITGEEGGPVEVSGSEELIAALKRLAGGSK